MLNFHSRIHITFFSLVLVLPILCAEDLGFLLKELEKTPPQSQGLSFGIELEGTAPLLAHKPSRLFADRSQLWGMTLSTNRALIQLGFNTEVIGEPTFSPSHGYLVYANGYEIQDGKNQGRWRLLNEGMGPFYWPLFHQAVEITSPIFNDESSIETFNEVVSQAKKDGFRQRPHRGGLHVHIGVPDPTSRQALIAGAIYAHLIDQTADELNFRFGVSPARNMTKPSDALVLERSTNLEIPILFAIHKTIENGGGINEFLAAYARPKDSYPIPFVRLDSLANHGTIETTLWNSTEVPQEVEEAVRFSRALMTKIIAQDEKLLEFLKRNRTFDLTRLLSAAEIRVPRLTLKRICTPYLGALRKPIQSYSSSSPVAEMLKAKYEP